MRIPLAVTVVAALALPAAAAAKEVTAVTVCGAHACTRLTDHASLDAFMRAGGLAEEAPGAPQRSYLLRVRISEPGSDHVDNWTSHWLPDAGLIASREDGGGLVFTRVEPALERVLRRAARGHAARPARRFVRHDPVARVVEVVPPPASAPRPAAADAGGSPPPAWVWVGGALLLLAAAGAGALRALRARSLGRWR
jgi:hypothetical protein